MTAVAGVPLIVGAVFGWAATVIVNAGSDRETFPSLTLMTIFPNVPTLAVVGVPWRRPVLPLNVAQPGRFEILNVRGSPLASLAAGVNVYCVPTVADVGGLPVIVGAVFVAGAVTVIENAGSDAVLRPSLTEITMLLYVRTLLTDGVPRRRPVVVLNVAQDGRLLMENRSVLPSGSLATG
jgi:hypothetical protein